MRVLFKSKAAVAPPLRRANDAAAALLLLVLDEDGRREDAAAVSTFVAVCKELAGIMLGVIPPAFMS